MNYPVWWIPAMSGALLPALAGVLFACCLHLYAGGVLLLPLARRQAEREPDDGLLDTVRACASFLTQGGVAALILSGAGVWIAVSLASPDIAATLNSVFALLRAAAWLCLLLGLLALLRWLQILDRGGASRGRGLAVFALLATLLAAGLLGAGASVTLTPGDWIHKQGPMAAVFSPAFWPLSSLRLFLSLSLAGLLFCVAGARSGDAARQASVLRFAWPWVCWPTLCALACGAWFVAALPLSSQALLLTPSPATTPLLNLFVIFSALIALGAPALARIAPSKNRPALACFLLLLGLAQTGLLEGIVAAGRGPWAISGHTWANGLRIEELDTLTRDGALRQARWVPPEAKEQETGRFLFATQCLPCHSIGGPLRDMRARAAPLTRQGMEARLRALGRLGDAMPPFAGTKDERAALAAYLVKEPGETSAPRPPELPQLPLELPGFDPDKAAYLLLAWTDTGMSMVSDADRFFSLSPPGLTLRSQLIRRGRQPELVAAGVTVNYALDPAFAAPSRQVRFWDFVASLFTRIRLPDQGLTDNYTQGTMQPLHAQRCFAATLLPVLPCPDTGGFNPYPLTTLEARDERSGELLTTTRVPAPASTELGCGICHGAPGAPEARDRPSLDERTARNILAAHDRRHGTSLLKNALWTHPKACQQCHADASLPDMLNPAKGTSRLNLSAALHGVHAVYMDRRDDKACASCHPCNPAGQTRSLRGVHSVRGLDCTHCHGALEDHARALLLAEAQAGKPRAERIMRSLEPLTASAHETIRPRSAWRMQPDCASCHGDPPGQASARSAFNAWTDGQAGTRYQARRGSDSALYCAACHNSAHAEYPSVNPYGKDRDNMQPLQYQGRAAPLGAGGNCRLCHLVDMPASTHHHRSRSPASPQSEDRERLGRDAETASAPGLQ